MDLIFGAGLGSFLNECRGVTNLEKNLIEECFGRFFDFFLFVFSVFFNIYVVVIQYQVFNSFVLLFWKTQSLLLETQKPEILPQIKHLNWLSKDSIVVFKQNLLCCMKGFTCFRHVFPCSIAIFICDKDFLQDFSRQDPWIFYLFQKNILCIHSCDIQNVHSGSSRAETSFKDLARIACIWEYLKESYKNGVQRNLASFLKGSCKETSHLLNRHFCKKIEQIRCLLQESSKILAVLALLGKFLQFPQE